MPVYKDLSETTSTVDPFQLDDILDYVYPKKEKNDIQKENKHNRRKLLKLKK